MPAAESRALFDEGDVRLLPFDPMKDRSTLRSLAIWAERFAPAVGLDEPNGLLLDVSGCGPLFGSEEQLARKAWAGFRRLGFQTRVTIAPTYGAAWGVTRFGSDDIAVIQADQQSRVVPDLPVAALRLTDDTVAALNELGIERIKHLMELPRSTLPSRFDKELLLRLDRMLGHAFESIDPVRPKPPTSTEQLFDGPTAQLEAIELAIRGLIEATTAQLRERESGARSLEIQLSRSDLPPFVITITLGRPSRDSKHIWKLISPKLERAHLGFGVEGVLIRVTAVARLRHQQLRTDVYDSSGDDHGQSVAEFADTVTNRLGRDSVVRASLLESHVPEQAFALSPALDAVSPVDAGLCTHDRPTILFDQPVQTRAIALTPDGPVHRVLWQGSEQNIISCLGPERITPEWWQRRSGSRDYFTVQTEAGQWLWVARSIETGRWYIHGAWA